MHARLALEISLRRWLVKVAGAHRSENAGMSSAKQVKTLLAECLRFPWLCQSSMG
jgi:hypothetical protein